MKRGAVIMLLCLSVFSAHAAVTKPTNFAYGLTLQPQSGKPLQALTLPDAVYAAVTRADLGDIRVFNADDVAVPYALCPAQEPASQPERRQALPVFALRRAVARNNGGTQVEIETGGGTRVHVLEPVAPDASDENNQQGRIAAYVIDARGVSGQISQIRVQ